MDFRLFERICDPIDPVKGCVASVYILIASDFLRIVLGFAYLVFTGVEEPGAVSLLLYNYFGVPSITTGSSFFNKSIDYDPMG